MEHLLHIVQAGLSANATHERGLRIARSQMTLSPLPGAVHRRLRSDVLLDIPKEGPGGWLHTLEPGNCRAIAMELRILLPSQVGRYACSAAVAPGCVATRRHPVG